MLKLGFGGVSGGERGGSGALLVADQHGAGGEPAHSNQHHQQRERRCGKRNFISAGEFAKAIPGRWRACLHRLIDQIALHVAGHATGGVVAPGSIFFHRLHHDPVQLAAHEPAELFGLGLAMGGDGGELFAQRA